MQIAQVLAGYTLGGADLLRRAMGKKKPEEMAQAALGVRRRRGGARRAGSSRRQHIFDLMEKFAGYGFNKSHSAAYALLSYQTAYLKAHYPAEFMAAVLSADMDHTDKVVTLIDECADMGLAVLPPDVNASRYEFAVAGARPHPLRPRRGEGRGRGRGRGADRRARGARPLREPRGPVPAARPAEGQPAGAGGAAALRQPRLASAPTAPRSWSGSAAAMQLGDQSTRAHEAGQDDLFGGPAAAERTGAPSAARAAALPEWSEAVRLPASARRSACI